MAAMRFQQVQRFILAKKYFGLSGTLTNNLTPTEKKKTEKLIDYRVRTHPK